MGAKESGKDMVSGEVNRAENTTRVWAQQNVGKHFASTGPDDNDFGVAILIVENAVNLETGDTDHEFVLGGQRVHGIMSSGCGKGAGVVGLSSHSPVSPPIPLTADDTENSQDVGVFGKGTTGIVGQGLSNRAASEPPLWAGYGAGVIGRGNEGGSGDFKAAGVIGLSGPSSLTLGSAGGATVELRAGEETGVFGQGVTGVAGVGTSGPGVRGTGGDVAVGVTGGKPGVVGVGGKGVGTTSTGDPVQGTGVVGVGLGNDVSPPFDEFVGTGVLGYGQSGVRGIGLFAEGRGGIFEAQGTPQVQLVPVTVPEEQPTFVSPLITRFPKLPKTGVPGDLMSVLDSLGQCTLYFCVGKDTSGTALWAQVQLGTPFLGT
jgi:hypothetical protein